MGATAASGASGTGAERTASPNSYPRYDWNGCRDLKLSTFGQYVERSLRHVLVTDVRRPGLGWLSPSVRCAMNTPVGG